MRADLGQFEEAEEAYRASIAIAQERADTASEAATSTRIGLLHSRRDEHPQALAAYESVLAIHQAPGDGPNQAIDRATNIGKAPLRMGET